MDERWSLWVMQVVQDHHGRMLRASELIELIVVSDAQRQEGLAGIEKFTLFYHIWVFTFLCPASNRPLSKFGNVTRQVYISRALPLCLVFFPITCVTQTKVVALFSGFTLVKVSIAEYYGLFAPITRI
jgi:hypothetical protein